MGLDSPDDQRADLPTVGKGDPSGQASHRSSGDGPVADPGSGVEWLKTAIANQRQGWETLMKMQQLTAEYMLKNLPNPSRRKRLTKK